MNDLTVYLIIAGSPAELTFARNVAVSEVVLPKNSNTTPMFALSEYSSSYFTSAPALCATLIVPERLSVPRVIL